MNTQNDVSSIQTELKKVNKDLLHSDNIRRTMGWSITEEMKHETLLKRQRELSQQLDVA
jgi:hypothetical protein